MVKEDDTFKELTMKEIGKEIRGRALKEEDMGEDIRLGGVLPRQHAGPIWLAF